ncbi:MAG: HAD hydrolase-like protein [Candidatus Micrarchaeaceae archaeon]|jgi:phosphoglycolate phosphatase-like HAD superfamily hydrolase
MAEKVVLFDIDNTLVREWKDVSQYYVETIRNTYGVMIDDIDLSKYEGMTVQETVEGILSANGLNEEEINAKRGLFLQELPYNHYNVAGHDKVELIDGAKDLLQHAHKRGYVIGAATGQLEGILRNMFDRAELNYDSYFKFGTYGDASTHIKEIIETSIDVAHRDFLADRQNIIFMSSSKDHVVAAQSLGIIAIGVVTDERSRKEMEGLTKGNVAKKLKDCEKWLK